MKFIATPAPKPLSGVFPAVLKDVEVRERDGREFLLWLFEVEHRGERRRLSRPTSTSFGPSSTARVFAEALLGRPVSDGEEVDVDDLLDLPCRLVCQQAVTVDGKAITKVVSVLPADDVPD